MDRKKMKETSSVSRTAASEVSLTMSARSLEAGCSSSTVESESDQRKNIVSATSKMCDSKDYDKDSQSYPALVHGEGDDAVLRETCKLYKIDERNDEESHDQQSEQQMEETCFLPPTISIQSPVEALNINELLQKKDSKLIGYLVPHPDLSETSFSSVTSPAIPTIDTDYDPRNTLKFEMAHTKWKDILRVISPKNIRCNFCAKKVNLHFHYLGTTDSYIYDVKGGQELFPYQQGFRDPLKVGHRRCVEEENKQRRMDNYNNNFVFSIVKEEPQTLKALIFLGAIWTILRIILMPIFLIILLYILGLCEVNMGLSIFLRCALVIDAFSSSPRLAREFAAAWKHLSKTHLKIDLTIIKNHETSESTDNTFC